MKFFTSGSALKHPGPGLQSPPGGGLGGRGCSVVAWTRPSFRCSDHDEQTGPRGCSCPFLVQGGVLVDSRRSTGDRPGIECALYPQQWFGLRSRVVRTDALQSLL